MYNTSYKKQLRNTENLNMLPPSNDNHEEGEVPTDLSKNADITALLMELVKIRTQLPVRRYLTRTESADYLAIGVEAFIALKIPFCNLSQNSKRWDVKDIINYMDNNKTSDSVQNSVNPTQRRGRVKCEYTKEKAHRDGGQRGMTTAEFDVAKVLELPTKKRQRH